MGPKRKSNYRFCRAEDDSSEELTENCTTITKIHAKYFGKDIINWGEILSLIQLQLLQFIMRLREDRELQVQEIPSCYSPYKGA